MPLPGEPEYLIQNRPEWRGSIIHSRSRTRLSPVTRGGRIGSLSTSEERRGRGGGGRDARSRCISRIRRRRALRMSSESSINSSISR